MDAHPRVQAQDLICDLIYDVLVAFAGARDDEANRLQWRRFWYHHEGREYRFGGELGFGGKFWLNHGNWYVSCYREDQTPERNKVVKRTNEALQRLNLIVTCLDAPSEHFQAGYEAAIEDVRSGKVGL